MNSITAYKVFDINMKAYETWESPYLNFQVGAKYKCEGKINIRQNGFAAYENPIFALDSNPNLRYCIVELSGDIKRVDNVTMSSEMTIVREIDIFELLEHAKAYIYDHKLFNKDYMSIYTTQDHDMIASCARNIQMSSSFNYTRIVSFGVLSYLSCSGSNAVLYSSGEGSNISASGAGVTIYSTGCRARISTTSEVCNIYSSGNNSNISVLGYACCVRSVGKNCNIYFGTESGIFCAKKGTYVSYNYIDDNDETRIIRNYIVGENDIKEDIWYGIYKGELSELLCHEN